MYKKPPLSSGRFDYSDALVLFKPLRMIFLVRRSIPCLVVLFALFIWCPALDSLGAWGGGNSSFVGGTGGGALVVGECVSRFGSGACFGFLCLLQNLNGVLTDSGTVQPGCAQSRTVDLFIISPLWPEHIVYALKYNTR